VVDVDVDVVDVVVIGVPATTNVVPPVPGTWSSVMHCALIL
jgi:hypothetical protein